MGHKLSKEKRIEVGLPGKHGGSGMANLHTAVSASYISTIIAMIPTLKVVAPTLYQFFIDQLKGDDCFHVHYAYEKIRGDFD